jgi:hypothetical protein
MFDLALRRGYGGGSVGEGPDDFWVVSAVVGAEVAAFAAFEPFLAALATADVEFPAFADKWRQVTMPESKPQVCISLPLILTTIKGPTA